ncbi:MAG TPA: orotate phosphoribosyltransferase, partial [Candidatus Hydrogenedentes bacterium]|nr:orotate phosphoribosyltransferase [Candidatus Hydrogenedentota bacterium]
SREDVALVVGPATGGIVLAYETARHLRCRAAFSEKDDQGGMAVKRGVALAPGTRTLVVEDIVTTGGSVKKTVAHLRQRGADVVGVAVLIDRSRSETTLDCRFVPLARLGMDSWEPDECPLCKKGLPVIEPDDLLG